jgi:hypothetical protein
MQVDCKLFIFFRDHISNIIYLSNDCLMLCFRSFFLSSSQDAHQCIYISEKYKENLFI